MQEKLESVMRHIIQLLVAAFTVKIKITEKYLKVAFQYCYTHHLELAKKSKFKSWPAVICDLSIVMIHPFQKSPRRGIEPRSPAWQAGILTTILSRMIYYSDKIFEKSFLFPTENCIRTFKNTCSTSFLHNSSTCL